MPSSSQALSNEWKAVEGLGSTSVELTSTSTYRTFDMDPVIARGRWVRMTAFVPDASKETRLTVLGRKGDERITFSTPTHCARDVGVSICETLAWIPGNATAVRGTVWSASTPATIANVTFEVNDGTSIDPESQRRLDDLMAALKDLYYRTAEVDWAKIHHAANAALAAPSGFDPLPAIMLHVIKLLPGNQHIHVAPHALLIGGEQPDGEAPAMPSCTGLSNDVNLLTLPSAAGLNVSGRDRYVEIANRCLVDRPAGTRWIIDVRTNGGWHSEALLASVAPLFDAGVLYDWQTGHGKRLAVQLTEDGIVTDGRIERPRKLPVGLRSAAKVAVWIGPSCGSACEIFAFAMHGRPGTMLVGAPTAGVATANQAVPINDEYDLYVTSARMVGRNGRVSGDRIEPDKSFPFDDSDALARVVAAWSS